jgi:hypothetical protein
MSTWVSGSPATSHASRPRYQKIFVTRVPPAAASDCVRRTAPNSSRSRQSGSRNRPSSTRASSCATNPALRQKCCRRVPRSSAGPPLGSTGSMNCTPCRSGLGCAHQGIASARWCEWSWHRTARAPIPPRHRRPEEGIAERRAAGGGAQPTLSRLAKAPSLYAAQIARRAPAGWGTSEENRLRMATGVSCIERSLTN